MRRIMILVTAWAMLTASRSEAQAPPQRITGFESMSWGATVAELAVVRGQPRPANISSDPGMRRITYADTILGAPTFAHFHFRDGEGLVTAGYSVLFRTEEGCDDVFEALREELLSSYGEWTLIDRDTGDPELPFCKAAGTGVYDALLQLRDDAGGTAELRVRGAAVQLELSGTATSPAARIGAFTIDQDMSVFAAYTMSVRREGRLYWLCTDYGPAVALHPAEPMVPQLGSVGVLFRGPGLPNAVVPRPVMEGRDGSLRFSDQASVTRYAVRSRSLAIEGLQGIFELFEFDLAGLDQLLAEAPCAFLEG